jgi:acetolactate synthase-1/2/3 large subunit
VEAARRAEPAEWAELGRSSRQPIHPLRVCAALQPKLAAGAVFVSDGGEFGQWAQAALDAPHRLINGLSGSIGSGLPLALGARLACPDRPVLVTLGDGTFGYHALEFDTALRYALPIVAIVGNDARWNAEHQLQLRQYGPERAVGCTLLPSRYDRLVDALGGHGEFVEHPQDLEPALERALGSGRPGCLNILIEGLPAPAVRAGASGH